MSKYILSISIFSIVSSFVVIASAESTRKHISFLVAVIMMLIIISPLSNAEHFNAIDSFTENVELQEMPNNTNEIAAKYLAKSIAYTLKKQYNVKSTKIVVNTKETSTFDVEEVEIYTEASIIDIGIIKNDIEKLYKCKIKFIQVE